MCMQLVNTFRPRRNEQHFTDDIFKRIFFNESVWISIKSSLKFVPKGPINNIPALVQIMAWRHSGDKPLSEPMVVSLPTHICVTRPQWVNKYVQQNSDNQWALTLCLMFLIIRNCFNNMLEDTVSNTLVWSSCYQPHTNAYSCYSIIF